MDKIEKMKPVYERIAPSFGNSFSIKKFEQVNQTDRPFWHYHPEIEIVHILNGNGKRHIGNHMSHYFNGDLIMVGPNLPHYGFTDRFTNHGGEIVVQFRADFLGSFFESAPEMQFIRALFDRSAFGLSFFGNTKDLVGDRLNSLFYMNNFEKLIELIKILQIMGESREFEVLNVSGPGIVISPQDTFRLDEVFDYVRSNFQSEIALEEVSRLANMTIPSFCRYFKKQTKKTFIEFVNEYRITHACKLISDGKLSISDIAFECGFNNFSHFNRQFKKFTQKTPSTYKKNMSLQVIYLDS